MTGVIDAGPERARSAGARRARPAVFATLALLAGAGSTAAQSAGFTPGPWSRLDTEHFEFVYPAELAGWATHMAARMEAVHAAVSSLVGFAPEDRVTVVVDDPGNVSNGSMVPGPLLYVWPTPPGPRSMIGENRGWGEILAVHEFAHAAHLTRPSRNPRLRLLTSLIPVPVTRLMLATPRWATEGYATYVEGRLTGSGRPHGVWRPAVLRTWALEGQLPTYGAVSGTGGYYGGAMAYLVGSAFLEWLVEREGGSEALIPDVWRRLTARQERSFAQAFTGVFAAPPDELYGLFTVDVTERAIAVRDAVERAGGEVAGTLFQRYSWTTGDPAVSPDGRHLAVVRTSEDGPSRLVVVSTTPDTLTAEQRRRYREIFEADPEDVEPVQRRPRPQRPVATLHPALGQAPYGDPAWLPDGQGILVTRSDVVANGRTRPDLFVWDWESGGVRRVTRGQAIRDASPAPDGSWAVGTRCLHGSCDIVRIELDDGAVTTLAHASPLRPYDHPRVSPDGRTIVASAQVDGGWRLVAMSADGSGERLLGPADGADRFDAEFLPDGRLVLASTRGGIHDIEVLDPATGAVTPVTRVVGSAVAPAPTPDGAVFFLALHSRGWDLRRIRLDRWPATPIVATRPRQTPAAAVPPEPGEALPADGAPSARPYGLGPRSRILLPVAHLTADGLGGGLALGGTDPIGRLSWQLQAAYGDDAAPTAGSLRARYRGPGTRVLVEGFWARHAVAGSVPASGTGTPPAILDDDEAYYGALGALELHGAALGQRRMLRVGGSLGRLHQVDAARVLGFAEIGARLERGRAGWTLTPRVQAHVATGRTGDVAWTRWRVDGGVSLRGDRLGIGASGMAGRTDVAAGSVEAFAIGGAPPLLFDPAILSQRVAMPALESGTLRGQEVRTVQAELYGGTPFTTFLWAGDAVGDGRDWIRVAGVTVDQATPEVPFVRLPASRVQLGVARILDGPAADEWRAWLILGYQP